jgi:hypothetical protein
MIAAFREARRKEIDLEKEHSFSIAGHQSNQLTETSLATYATF